MADSKPFEIAGDPIGARVASNGEGLTLTVLEGEAALGRRRGIKLTAADAEPERVEWAHACLRGVHVYARKEGDKHHVVVTLQDLNP